MNKNIKKIITAIITFQVTSTSLGIGVATTTFAATKPTERICTIQSITNDIKVSKKTIKYSNKYIESTLKIPIVSGLKSKKVQNKINSYIENSMLKFRESMKKQAQKDITDLINSGQKTFNKYGAYTDYSVKLKGNNLFSLTADYYNYTGGAHGLTNERGLNFDLNTGKLISLSSIFQKNFDYKTVLKNAVKDYIVKNPDMVFPDAAENLKDVTKDREFYIEDGNLVLIFQQYEIGPYATGIQYVKVPLSDLKLSNGFKELL